MRECLRIVIPVVESRGGTVLRAYASHQCGSGLNPGTYRSWSHTWVAFVVSFRSSSIVYLRVVWFSSLHKNQYSKFYNEFNRAPLCFLRAELLFFISFVFCIHLEDICHGRMFYAFSCVIILTCRMACPSTANLPNHQD